MTSSPVSSTVLIPCLMVATAVCFFFSLCTGTADIAVSKGISDTLHGTLSVESLIIGEVRLPRALLALFIGGTLGLSGAALQGLLRNPLAEPGIIGVSNGAALGAVIVFYFGFSTIGWYI